MSSELKEVSFGAENVKWDLSVFFKGPDDPQIDRDIKDSERDIAAFVSKYKGQLKSLTSLELKAAYLEKDRIVAPLYKVSQYSRLLLSLDTQNDTAKNLVSRVDEMSSRLSNELVFFSLELGAIPNSTFDSLNNSDELGDYAYAVDYTRQKSKYRLSEKEEQLINLKDLTGIRSARQLYGEVTSGFSFEIELDGKIQKMNGSQLRNLRLHQDASVRERAMTQFFSKYEEHSTLFTHLYNTIIKDYNIERKMRGYHSSISVMNSGNDLDDDVVSILHEVTTESYSLVQRYYKLKAELCNLPNMTLSDIYSPLPETAKTYSWDEAKSLVLDSFKAFDDEFYNFSKDLFDNGYVDAPVNEFKRGGAFCSSSTPDMKPFVLLNYQGKPRDISTIAHEFGHAIHAILSNQQVLTNYHSILPLCETASVFAEMVLMDHLKSVETDKIAKISLLADKLEDLFATSHRQNMFSTFELDSHAHITDELMSSSQLCQLYHDKLKEMFGDSVQIPDHYHWEWATIPHIYDVPFYVHSYNFGNLLVLALYGQYLEDGKSFVPKLKHFLASGSSQSPQVLTQALGVDIYSKDFWLKSLIYIEQLVNELEDLIRS